MYSLRIIFNALAAGKKFTASNLLSLTKLIFRRQENKIIHAAKSYMNTTSNEIISIPNPQIEATSCYPLNEATTCAVHVVGT